MSTNAQKMANGFKVRYKVPGKKAVQTYKVFGVTKCRDVSDLLESMGYTIVGIDRVKFQQANAV